MKDARSQTKAKADWDQAQAAAYRRCTHAKQRSAYLQGQAHRITHNINEMDRFEQIDATVAGRHVNPRWPYRA